MSLVLCVTAGTEKRIMWKLFVEDQMSQVYCVRKILSCVVKRAHGGGRVLPNILVGEGGGVLISRGGGGEGGGRGALLPLFSAR